MSFDELHNITDSGAAAAQGQAGAVNKLAEALDKLKGKEKGDLANDKSQGIVVPIRFNLPPIPPIPPIPPVPPVVFPALDLISPVLLVIQTKIGALPKLINVPVSVIGEAIFASTLISMQNKLSEWKTEAVKSFNTVSEAVLEWETSAIKSFGNVKTTISGWQSHAVVAFGLFAVALALDFSIWFKAAAASIHTWQTSASTDFKTFATSADTAMATFASQFKTAWNDALGATETMVGAWAKKVETAFSSAVSSAMSAIASLAKAAGKTIANGREQPWGLGES